MCQSQLALRSSKNKVYYQLSNICHRVNKLIKTTGDSQEGVLNERIEYELPNIFIEIIPTCTVICIIKYCSNLFLLLWKNGSFMVS